MAATQEILSEGPFFRRCILSTFVSVGNARQRFDRLFAEVERIASELPQPVIVQTGHTSFESEKVTTHPFLSMLEFEQQIAKADLVIVHAGVGSVLTALKAGKTPVIVPRQAAYGEHIDDHQLAWARAFGSSGRVVVVEDIQDLLAMAGAAIAEREGGGASALPQGQLLAMVRTALIGGKIVGSLR